MISPFRDGFIFAKLRGRSFAKIKPSRIYLYLQYSKFLNSVNCLPDSDALCRLLITFTKSLDPDQARHNVESGLLAWSLFQWFDTLMVLMIATFEKVNSGKEENITPPPAPQHPPPLTPKNRRRQNCMQNYPACKTVVSVYEQIYITYLTLK